MPESASNTGTCPLPARGRQRAKDSGQGLGRSAITTVCANPGGPQECHTRAYAPPPGSRGGGGGYSLVAPVEARGDVALHVLCAVVSQVAQQHLPPQVQHLVHDVPQPVEEVALVPLGNTQTGDAASAPALSCGVTTRGGEGRGLLTLRALAALGTASPLTD